MPPIAWIHAMQDSVTTSNLVNWIFGTAVFAIGVLNLLLVHPVPGLVCLLLSLVYVSPVNTVLKARFGISIPLAVKVTLGIVVIWFTLGVSDLGDMID